MGALSPLIMMGLMFVVFYFLLIRPQVKKQKEQAALLAKLGKGETVITRGGIIGTITGVQGNDVVVLEIQEKVRIRIPRAYIESKWTEKSETKADKAEKSDKAA
jgi:preprotein translocase subunit YajC